MTIEGEEYPVELWKQYIAKAIGVLQMGIFAIIFLGNTVTDMLGITDNVIVTKLTENKMMACFGTFMLCNNAIGMCLSSGAFEMYVDGKQQQTN